MCSTLIPYFAEPDDIRLNITNPEPALSMSSAYHQSFSSSSSPFSSLSLSPNLYSSSSAASLRSPQSGPHNVYRRSSSSSSSSHEEDSTAEDTDTEPLYSEEQTHLRSKRSSVNNNTKHHSTTTATTRDRRDASTSHRKRSGSKPSPTASESKNFRREGNDHQTAISGNSSQHSNRRHDPTRSRPGNRSLMTVRPTHGHRTLLLSESTPNYPEDPVVARLLRRFVLGVIQYQ